MGSHSVNIKQKVGQKNLFIPVIFLLSSLYVIFLPYISSSYVDEASVALLIMIGIFKLRWSTGKEFRVILCILLAYLIYSFIWGRNVIVASLKDFLIFLKPFISFFIPFLLPIYVSRRGKRFLRFIFLMAGIVLIVQAPTVIEVYSKAHINSTQYYTSCIITALAYLMFSKLKKKDWIIALIILSCGLVTLKAKFFTEYVFIVFVIFFLKQRVKINLKWMTMLAILAGLSIYLSFEKFEIYFINGLREEASRSIFYMVTPQILIDYFPFGPGFGTFNTDASGQFYSPLYKEYQLNYIWGIRPEDYKTSSSFFCDTFYPALAQFGIVGVVLYIWFWCRRWRESASLDLERYKLFLVVFVIIAVENIASNGFTSSNGVPFMMSLGMLLSQKNNICKL